ncbi:DUF4350 domain-containing protein [Microbacterium sp. 2FI]|uniref:DUF4350 domain-containing protein n=1 Tax=Microbacterium sp. 2FI TaxID=2502193 RepID=UPI0020177F5B|nr:DUF4350 domain-containing protein [Microbacterium sp. 2FI]
MNAVEIRTPSRRRRSVAAWIAIGLALLLVGGIGSVLSSAGEWAQRDALDPDSAGPFGTRALAEVLRDHGVEVLVERDRASAIAALGSGNATLVLPDAPALSDDGILSLTEPAADVVLIDPRARTLDLLLAGSTPAGFAPGGLVEPECDLPEATRSGAIEPGALFAPGGSGDAVACYPSGDGYALLVGPHADGTVAAVDGGALLTNEHLADDGNAALAVNLMGGNPRVVWYAPGLGDTDLENTDPSLGELTPPWVSPVILLLLVAGVAAAIWRGRRFGPLVAERLPVSVRVSETTEGRARLYAQARDAVHAADQLRIGALTRIARSLGLGPAASADEIADAAAAVTGIDRGAARGILIHDVPAGDADLVALAAHIRHLEEAVNAAIRPERNPR